MERSTPKRNPPVVPEKRGDPKGGGKKKVLYPKKTPSVKKKPKRKPQIKKGVVLILVACILISVSLLSLDDNLPELWGGPWEPERASFTIERTITIRAERDLNFNLTVPIPEDIPGNDLQYVTSIDWNQDPDTFEKYDQEWKSWTDSLSGEEREIIITYNVNTSSVRWGYSRKSSGSVDQFNPYLVERYGGNQWQLDQDRNRDGEMDWMIQPEHPEIRSLAEELTQSEVTVYGKAQRIYDWIVRNIDYELGAPGELPKHAIWTLQDRRGDCDEQAYLYISLARAVGIPAWVELGILYDRPRNVWGGHGWVRLQYVSYDGQSGWVNIDTVNRDFFFRGATRITTYVDDGNGTHLNDYYHYVTYNFTGGNPGFGISESYSNLEIETEGRILKTDGYDLPWFGVAEAIPLVGIAVIIHFIKNNKFGKNGLLVENNK